MVERRDADHTTAAADSTPATDHDALPPVTLDNGQRWKANPETTTGIANMVDILGAYDPASGRFSVPGSVMPLLTILAIFLLKYTLGIELAMQPALRFEASFALAMAAGYGALTGLFASRPLGLWRLSSAARAPMTA